MFLQVWCDWKAGIKKKIATNKKEAKATGGGPYNQLYVSQKEETIGRLCGLYAIVEGIQNSHSFGTERSSSESSSSDEEDTSHCQSSASKSTPVNNKRKRVENETLDETPSTSKRSTLSFKHKDDVLKDHLKEYIGSDIQNSKELSESLKLLGNISQKNSEQLEMIGSNIRRVYKAVENLSSTLTNELKRHHEEMEKAAFEKNQLKKTDLEIKQKSLELELLKNSNK